MTLKSVLTVMSVLLGGELGGDRRAQPPPRREGGDDFHLPGTTSRDEVFEDAIGHMLVKHAVIAEALQVQLERFELDAQPVGDVSNRQLSEIGLTGLGADRRELRTDRFDRIIAVRELVFESLQLFG